MNAEMEEEYQQRYRKTVNMIQFGELKKDNYVCKCGRINVFGGEGHISRSSANSTTKVFHCGYCEDCCGN